MYGSTKKRLLAYCEQIYIRKCVKIDWLIRENENLFEVN